MLELIKLFFDIALLKKTPADVPNSIALQSLVIGIDVAVSFLMLFMSESWTKALSEVVVDIMLMALFCKFTLYWGKKPARYRQTFIALIGIDTLISFFAFPALAVFASPMPEGSSPISLLAVVVFTILILWHWVIAGHIFRHALSESFIFGLGIALLYLMLSYQLDSLLFA